MPIFRAPPFPRWALLLVLVTGCCAASDGWAGDSPTDPPNSLAADAGLDTAVYELALVALDRAREDGDIASRHDHLLTVIDYSMASTKRRLWVFDLETQVVLFNELVAHGQNTGGNRAKHFSNDEGSHKSSVGVFRTGRTYRGKHGYSLRLDGLEPGFNDLARERAIVIHGADYVTEDFIDANGRLGRSWGCPALDPAVAQDVIDTIRGGSLLVAYYPDDAWLSESAYVGESED
jgi:hypothetical protein